MRSDGKISVWNHTGKTHLGTATVPGYSVSPTDTQAIQPGLNELPAAWWERLLETDMLYKRLVERGQLVVVDA